MAIVSSRSYMFFNSPKQQTAFPLLLILPSSLPISSFLGPYLLHLSLLPRPFFCSHFLNCSPLTTKIFQLQEVALRQKVSQTYSLLSGFLFPPVCLRIKDLIRRKLWMEAGLGLSLLVGHRTYYNGWCCGDMLIGSLQASAEQQSLTIRKNNDFTMKEPTLLTSGRISMHCRSLEGSCRPQERSAVGNASCLFKARLPPLLPLL